MSHKGIGLNQIGGGRIPLDFLTEVAKGHIAGHSLIHKYGVNIAISPADGYETIWSGGVYTGQDPTIPEKLTTTSLAPDAGTLLISSATTCDCSAVNIIDAGTDFISDGVSPGDVVINDTQLDHAIITEVHADRVVFRRMSHDTSAAEGDSFRIATKASTGAPVSKMDMLLDDDYNEHSEYIILNGAGGVDTVGDYIRHSRSSIIGGMSAGDITTTQKVTTANKTVLIPSYETGQSYNSSMLAAYTVPAGKDALFVHWFVTIAKKQAAFANGLLLTREVGDAYQVKEEGTSSSTGSSVLRPFLAPKNSVGPMTDIKIISDASVPDIAIAGGFTLLLVDRN